MLRSLIRTGKKFYTPEDFNMKKKANGWALLPIVVFLVLYLGNGIYFEYINPVKGRMGFYVMSVVVAFTIALTVAFIQVRELSFDDKIHICAQAIGDDNITYMLFIFIFAGAFSGIASEAGGAASTANMLLDLLPGKFAVPGLFVIACLISMAMGTSVGTISVLTPIAVSVSNTGGSAIVTCVAAVCGGAMFGDNLSFISDTTIAATRTQNVDMKDKFRVNFKIALPAAIATLAVLIVTALSEGGAAQMNHYDFNLIQALPYFIVLATALAGVNVIVVLGAGIIMFFAAGIMTGSLTYTSAFTAMGTGTSNMYETMIVTILVASIGALINEHGGFAAILEFIQKHFRGRRGGMFGIGLLTSLIDIATANNTVAIVMAGPIAKEISHEYDIEPKQSASLLDIFSCIWQGIIPYGAQLLVAAGAANITSVSIISRLYYPFFLLISVILSIVFFGGRKKEDSINDTEKQ
jgi:Na+/H+ antiporter NhaC